MRPHGASALLPATVTMLLGARLTVCAQQPTNPFAPPTARTQVAPVSGYDLQSLTLELNANYPKRLLTAVATNRLVVVAGGLSKLRFHAGAQTKIDSVQLNGRRGTFVRDKEGILVDCPPAKRGAKIAVVVRYHLQKSDPPGASEFGGWHWHEPQRNDPSRVGFWTKGEPDHTRDWAVTWDYPNDFAITETRTTVPTDWDVIGNGLMVSDKKSHDGKTHTVVWRMAKPHATYLTSVVAGPFDIQRDEWRGIPLIYAAPRGPKPGSSSPNDRGFDIFSMRRNDGGRSLAYTVAHTKQMMAFFSDRFGVPYPWPKYAQTFTYDHNGGMENVSATTMGNFLTNPRQGHHGSDQTIAHELAHQWFGDLVTCRDWGQLWVNESLAVFAEGLWNAESRGMHAVQRNLGFGALGYFGESQQYKRPVATSVYSEPRVMFDSHSYAKGGVLLHSLRMSLGDAKFFAGLTRFLKENRHSPAGTSELCAAMSKAAGVDLKPWFDQWILKPGHPVIEWSWSWDEAKSEAVVKVKQAQDTSAGTPIYDMPTEMGFLYDRGPSHVDRRPIHVSLVEQEFRVPLHAKPDAAMFDPDQDFLRQIRRNPWTDAELPVVARWAPSCFDRQTALNRMLTGTPSDAAVQAAVEMLKRDHGFEPAFLDTSRLMVLKRADLRPFWELELSHENFTRRNLAVAALGMLPSDSGTNGLLRSMVSDKQPYDTVAAVIKALATLDFAGNRALIERQASASEDRPARAAALIAMLVNKAPNAADLVFRAVGEDQPISVQAAGLEALAGSSLDDPRLVPMLRARLRSDDYYGLLFNALTVARNLKVKAVLPEIRELGKRVPMAHDFIDSAIKAIEAP